MNSYNMSSLGKIPITVGSDYVSANKVTLPMSFEVGNPTEILFMEYPFTLEENVIQWCETNKQNQAKTSQGENSDVSSGSINKEGHNSELSEGCNANAGQGDINDTDLDLDHGMTNGCVSDQRDIHAENLPLPQNESREALVQPPMNNTILVPTPVGNVETVQNPVPDKNCYNNIDLQDFESEQDPFDNLELKVLDDMAELNKVLQGAQPSDS